MRLSRKETNLGNRQDLAALHQQCPPQTFPGPHEASSSSVDRESHSNGDTCPAMEDLWVKNPKAENRGQKTVFASEEDSAKRSSTLHFASLFLLVKLFSKTATLLHLDKSHKKLRMVKLMKLAK
jgi:hypothetical protein